MNLPDNPIDKMALFDNAINQLAQSATEQDIQFLRGIVGEWGNKFGDVDLIMTSESGGLDEVVAALKGLSGHFVETEIRLREEGKYPPAD